MKMRSETSFNKGVCSIQYFQQTTHGCAYFNDLAHSLWIQGCLHLGYALSGHCGRQQVSVKSEGASLEGYLFTGFYSSGGRAFFQMKRMKQLPCSSPPLVVVYIVLCSEIHNCMWNYIKIARLERSKYQGRSRLIRGALQACFGLHPFFAIVHGQPCIFILTFLIISQSLTSSEREITLHDKLNDARTPIVQEAWNSLGEKMQPSPATLWPASRPRASSTPFLTAKNRYRTLNSETVHL